MSHLLHRCAAAGSPPRGVVDFEIKAQRAGRRPAERAASREPWLGRPGVPTRDPTDTNASSEVGSANAFLAVPYPGAPAGDFECIVAAWACTNFRHVTSVGRGRVAVPARHSSHSPSCDAAGRRGVDAFRYRHMMAAVARAATTSDAFNAIAEPQRREILVLLQGGERPVTELARDLGMSQPQASKHLRVLREVGLVRGRRAGKQRLYGLDARGLRPVHEWLGGFERFWSGSFDRLDEYVQDLKQARREEPPVGDDQ